MYFIIKVEYFIKRNIFIIIIIFDQYLRATNPATPALIQVSFGSFVNNSKYITKLVLWPVVIKVPFLLTT